MHAALKKAAEIAALTLAAAPSSRLLGALMDNRAARFVAQISFGIYVWHYLVIEFIIQKVLVNYPHEAIANMQTWLLVAAATVGIAFTLAWLSFRFLESPVIAWARGLEKPRPAREPKVGPAQTLSSKSQ